MRFDYVAPLIRSALAQHDDACVWELVYAAVAAVAATETIAAAKTTPPPRSMPSALHQTPWQHNAGSFVDPSEHRRDVDGVLRRELGSLHVGVPRFREAYFGHVAGLEAAADAVFAKCTAGRDALFSDRGWKGWPPDASQNGVLAWFTDLCESLEAMAVPLRLSGPARRPLAQPNTPLPGSTAIRNLDVGFARHVDSNTRYS